MRKALITGAGGFIGSHLVTRLRAEGYWVRGVDIRPPEFRSTAHEFIQLDLRKRWACDAALAVEGGFDEVYQLAADMGGVGFIHSAEAQIMRNNALINLNMVDAAAALKVPRYFYASSVCVYRDMQLGEPELREADAYPAMPDNEYGWEKLYAERVAEAYGRRSGMAVRIGRLQNCYGPESAWRGGREKAPAAICRKVAEAADGGTIDVWGDGAAVRSYIYIDDMVDGIVGLAHSDLEGAVNIGSPEYTIVEQLVRVVEEVARKRVDIRYVEGTVGVRSRNFSNSRIESLGWRCRSSLRDGIARTYPWVEAQVLRGGRSRRPAIHAQPPRPSVIEAQVAMVGTPNVSIMSQRRVGM